MPKRTKTTKTPTSKPVRARAVPARRVADGPLIHTKLTIDDIDKINGCRTRLLNAAVLLQLGLLHHDDDEVAYNDECIIPDALLDVVERLREDVTLIGALIDLAGPEPVEPEPADGAR